MAISCYLSVKQFVLIFLFSFLATLQEGEALLEPINVNNKRAYYDIMRGTILTGTSVFLSYTPSLQKATAADVTSIRAKEFPDAASFYQKYQYKAPKDILLYINDCDIKDGNAKGVIDALEIFSLYYPMYKLSTAKATILTNEIKKSQPKNILEIGTFFGYSALNMGSVMPIGSSLTCIEANRDNADVARIILDKGLGPNSKVRGSVRIIDGISSKVLDDKSNPLGNAPYDFVFLDHDKDCYLTDLKTLESKGMLASNCVIVADNVVFPGAPGYLEYVSGVGKFSVEGKTEAESGR